MHLLIVFSLSPSPHSTLPRHAHLSTTTQPTMESSHLAKLPGELRNEIYLAYFEARGIIEIHVDGERPVVKDGILALLQTCRQIHNEATGVLHSAAPIATVRILTNVLPHLCVPRSRIGAPTAYDTKRVEANIALALFGGARQISSYRVRKGELHLGRMGVSMPMTDGHRLRHSKSDWLNKLSTLVCEGLGVPTTLVCDLRLKETYFSVELAERMSSEGGLQCPSSALEEKADTRCFHKDGTVCTQGSCKEAVVLRERCRSFKRLIDCIVLWCRDRGMSEDQVKLWKAAVKQCKAVSAAGVLEAYGIQPN